MPFIVNKNNEVQFRYEIECIKCGSSNCEQYIAEVEGDWDACYARESVIRYRCLCCYNIADEEG